MRLHLMERSSPSSPPAAASTSWTDAELGDNPHAAADKAAKVERMFAAIAHAYDLNNRVHSLGRDQAWRQAAVRCSGLKPTDIVVDVACGTGDLALAFAKAGAARVLGIDFTMEMLAIAARKSPRPPRPGSSGSAVVNPKSTVRNSLDYARGDALRLPLPDVCCDVVSIAFGIRNVADPVRALREFHRVLRPGGRLVVLEFSTPTNPVLRLLNRVYCQRIMPVTATWIARDKSNAYKYLPRSVSTFLDRQAMGAAIADAGFTQVTQRPLTFGIAVLHRGVKG
jgi:demethylmenaquinone methyltransferase/2-methoxy-6-polyprenyl-1,4-benzoquinol methylase